MVTKWISLPKRCSQIVTGFAEILKHSILEGEMDFDEELKIRILVAIDDQFVGFNEEENNEE